MNSAVDRAIHHFADFAAELVAGGKTQAAIRICRAKGVAALETLYNLLEDRIAEFRLTPPPEDWDGSYIATEK